MRTIKFRGFSIALNDFVYGYLHYYERHDEFAIDDYAVNEDSISQFTGQHDKMALKSMRATFLPTIMEVTALLCTERNVWHSAVSMPKM